MDEFLVFFLELFFEVFLQLVASFTLDISSRALARILRKRLAEGFLVVLGYGLLGAVAGAISVALLPHRVFGPARVRGLSLVIAPLLTGTVMAATGAFLRRRKKTVVRIESFAYGVALGLGMAFVRFITVKP